jgi:DNA polymerase-1
MADSENPFSQLDGIKKGLNNLQIRYTEQSGYEADDMIASYALQTSFNVIIASSDTGFLQLICDRINMFCYRGKQSTLFTETAVKERYGISPDRFLEYKALIGDKIDNIDGVRGIGPKTAVNVLNGEKELTEDEQ